MKPVYNFQLAVYSLFLSVETMLDLFHTSEENPSVSIVFIDNR